MTKSNDDELIAGYIRGYTQPVQWVGWWQALVGSPAGDALSSTLFEPGGERLRDLTTPGMREEVTRIVLANKVLLQAVGMEVERILEAAADEAVRETAPKASP